MNPERTPAALLEMLARDMDELSEAAENFGKARRLKAQCQFRYEKEMMGALTELKDEYRKAGERLPAEEMRRAICHSRIDEDAYSNMLMAEAEVDSLSKLINVKTSNLSALQSELSFLRTEFAAA